MNRRRVLRVLAGLSATIAGGAAAEPAGLPVVGFLNTTSPGPSRAFVAAFREALAKAGYIHGSNVVIEERWAEGRYDQLPALVSGLVRQSVSVIAATGGVVAARAAKAATSEIPIVFIAGFDPVHEELVASLPRPGGNATGVSVYTAELNRKRLELLRELVGTKSPDLIGMLVNPGSISTPMEIRDLEDATRSLELRLSVFEARNESELQIAFERASSFGVKALLISADSFFTSIRDQIVSLASRYSLPTSYPWQQYVDAGGLMSYGPTLVWAYRQVGEYVAKILNGSRPEELPVQLPTIFDLVINLKTAERLGIAVPPLMRAVANRVIE